MILTRHLGHPDSMLVTKTMTTRSVGLYTELRQALVGPWPIPCLANCSRSAERVCLGFLCKPRAAWNAVSLFPLREMVVCFTHVKECRWSTLFIP